MMGSTSATGKSFGPMFKVSKFRTNIKTTDQNTFQSLSRLEDLTKQTKSWMTPSLKISNDQLQSSITSNYRVEESQRRTLTTSDSTNGKTLEESSSSYFCRKSDGYGGDDFSSSSDEKNRLKILEPPDDNMDIILARKKMFSSSSFYEEPHHIYPTMEEQVDLCRKIADSLSSDTNKLSRGQSMYNRRKQRAEKWVFEGPDPVFGNESNENTKTSTIGPSDKSNRNQSIGQNRKLKLVLDPRELQDAMKLRQSGLYNEHNVISPDICFDLVKDLNSPTGKGAALFAKRKKKSEKWIVDETTVSNKYQLPIIDHKLNTNQSTDIKSKRNPYQYQYQSRLKLIKSPWEAALESPIGSCEAAFKQEIIGTTVDDSGGGGPDVLQAAQAVLKRAEEKQQQQLQLRTGRNTSGLPYMRPGSNPDVYRPRGPRRWDQIVDQSSTSTERACSPNVRLESPIPEVYVTDLEVLSSPMMLVSPRNSLFLPGSVKPNWHLNQFANFNNCPRLWTTGNEYFKFRSVRPPTMSST